MKTYLLTEDQILGLMTCAMETGALGTMGLPAELSWVSIQDWFETPPEKSKTLNAVIFKRIKEIEIINEINEN